MYVHVQVLAPCDATSSTGKTLSLFNDGDVGGVLLKCTNLKGQIGFERTKDSVVYQRRFTKNNVPSCFNLLGVGHTRAGVATCSICRDTLRLRQGPDGKFVYNPPTEPAGAGASTAGRDGGDGGGEDGKTDQWVVMDQGSRG
jgi:hypothetical protein